MSNPQMVMYEEEFHQIQAIVDSLVKAANAQVVFIIDKNGQLIAAAGDTEQIDTTSLASLTAGNIAATGGMAKLLRENECSTQFHEGENANNGVEIETTAWLGFARKRESAVHGNAQTRYSVPSAFA